MSHHPAQVGRRRFLQLLAAGGALTALPLGAGAAQAAAAGPLAGTATAADDIAATYLRVLAQHTRWSETQWDAARGYYTDKDFGFAVVLGNAVLLTHGRYDSELTGIDRDTLRTRTLATIRHFAASNRLTGGDQWGRTLFFDTTFQSYFVMAAKLLWSELDGTTRGHVDALVRGQAAYTDGLGTGDDPASGSWTPHGLTGGFEGDTKLEEMGVYTQSLAPALAWAGDDARHGAWSDRFGTWSRNEAGLPPADLANPALVDGVPVSRNTARNLYDTFIVENHGSFGPHYQEELWRTSGRNSSHFLAAGTPLPEVLTKQPNADPLWQTLLGVMSDAGEPLMPMVNDREHLYGRDVIPLAFLARVQGDRAAARAEAELAARLEAYQEYAPRYRLAKFSGEPKYEPEARAEIALSYLLHVWTAHTPVKPLSREEFFARAAGVTDFGTGPGLVSHQSPAAWAAAVSKPGFVKFAWQPAHDDWLFKLSGGTPMFLPSATGKVSGRAVETWTKVRDGFDGSATLLRLDSGWAGFTTLGSGAVVYASSGTAAGEGHLEVYNLTMPGMPGLGGARTFRFAEGSVKVAARDGASAPAAGGRVDTLDVPRTTVRHLRMQGVRPDPTYGYSLFAFEARAEAGGEDLARGGTATASSAASGMGAALAVDGDGATRWAVATGDRKRADSWLAVDLGAAREVAEVTLRWEAAAGRGYRVQGSADGERWEDLAVYPAARASSHGGWLDVDGRAGLVVRGTDREHPVSVYDDAVVLSDGPAAPVVIEGYPGASPDRLRALAARKAPSAEHAQVRVAYVEEHLSLFNLSAEEVRTRVSVPQDGAERYVFAGTQTVTRDGIVHESELPAAKALLLAPRFTLAPVSGRALPAGLRVSVEDGATVRLSGASCRVRVRAQGRTAVVSVRSGGRPVVVRLHGATAYPVDDLALGRTVFPTSPLPAGMSAPSAAVDGDPGSSWRPGKDGRLVVDLGAALPVREIEAEWTGGDVPGLRVEGSTDGIAYRDWGRASGHGRTRALRVRETARYVAVRVDGGDGRRAARLVRLSVR